MNIDSKNRKQEGNSMQPTAADIKKIILGIIAEIIPDENLSQVKDDVRLQDQLELDSMDFLDLVMELKKRYRIDVPQEDFPKLSTLNSCAEYLAPKFKI